MPLARRTPLPVVLAAAAVLALALALRCTVLATLYDGDMELFVYMGKLVGHGGRIGIELIDNKLPTVGLVMWPLYAIIGAWWPGYALFGVVGAAVAVWATARAAAQINRSSLWPTAAMAAAWMSFPLAVFSAFKLEHLTVTTSALAAWAFVRCAKNGRAVDAILVGLLAGVGAMAKPNALAVLGAAWVALALDCERPWRERVRPIAWTLVGLAVPLVGTLVYLVKSRAIDALPAVYEQIRLYNHNSVWHPQTVLFKVITVLFLIALPLAMRGLLERRRAEAPGDASTIMWRFAGVWLVLEIIGIAMQGRMYGYHFLPITVPAALVFGLLPRRPMATAVVGSALPVLAASVFWAWTATLATERPADRLAAIDYVKSHSHAGDGVWMDEYARLLVERDLTAGSRVPLTFLFSNDDGAPARFGGMILADLAERRPRWVVLPADCVARAERLRGLRIEYAERPTRGSGFVDAWRRIETAVRNDYTPVATFGEQRVYERRDAFATIGE